MTASLDQFEAFADEAGLPEPDAIRPQVVVPSGLRPLPPIVWADDYLAESHPEPEQLVKGVLHNGCCLILGGASKSNKTWTLMDLAVSVANGVSWLGFETRPGAVLYLNFELQAPFFGSRLRKILSAKGLPSPGRLAIWNLRGYAAGLNRISAQIVAQARAEGFALIIFDPLYKLLGGADENAGKEMAELMNDIEKVAVETGAAIAYGAHYSKGNQAAKASIDRISGSGVFARAPDAIFTMTAHDEPEAFVVEPVLRYLAPVEPFVVRWQFPLMARDEALDPAKLKQMPKSGTYASKYSEDDILGQMSVLDGKSTKELERALIEEGWSRQTFYRYWGPLKKKVNAPGSRILCKIVAEQQQWFLRGKAVEHGKNASQST